MRIQYRCVCGILLDRLEYKDLKENGHIYCSNAGRSVVVEEVRREKQWDSEELFVSDYPSVEEAEFMNSFGGEVG